MTEGAKISREERFLSEESRHAADLIAAIGPADEELANDMVEGETSLIEAMTAAMDHLDQTEAMAVGIKSLIETYTGRLAAAERRAERIRAALLQALSVSGMRSVSLPAATLTAKAVPPKAIISDESAIPSEFWVTAPPRLDKAAISKAAKAGAIPGVEMSNGGEALQIRRK